MSYWYLASPYSKYHAGLDAAYAEVCRNAALLMANNIPIFCPISHGHGFSVHGGIDPLDHEIWLKLDRAMMVPAKGLIVCKMEGWRSSVGVSYEMGFFEAHRRRIVYMEPGVVPDGLKA